MSEAYIQLGNKLRDAAADPNAAPTHIQLGTPLRDAAVDPRPEDNQAPTNAGREGPDGNPHWRNVVSVQALSPRSGNPPRVDGQEI